MKMLQFDEGIKVDWDEGLNEGINVRAVEEKQVDVL